MTNSPHWDPADSRIEACRSVPAQSRTATGETANEVRQVGPPTDTARFLRQSESANQRAPTAGEHSTRSAPCRSSHRSVPISRGSIPHRHRPTPPNRSAKQVHQLTPPSCSASQRAPIERAPTVGDRLPRSVTCQSSHRSVPISLGSNPYRHRRHRQRGPPTRSAKQIRQLTPPSSAASQRAPTRERQLPVSTSPDR